MKATTYSVPMLGCRVIRERTIRLRRASIDHAPHVADVARGVIGEMDREHLIALFVNAKNEVTGVHTIAIGGLSAVMTSPREVFKAAIVNGARGIVLAHNHPSGDPTPSAEDRAFTDKAVEAGKLLGIPVLDHVVIGRASHVSFLDRGYL